MILPEPPQRGQPRSTAKKPWVARTRPAPPQAPQTVGLGPGLAPEPSQVSQVMAALGTVRLATAAAEHLPKDVAEHVVEDVAGVEALAAEPARPALRTVDAGMAEAVIGRAL